MIVFKESKDGQHYFVVKAGNGRILATSEMYKTKQMAKHGAKSLTRNASLK